MNYSNGQNPIRLRCLLLGLFLIPANNWWVFQLEGNWLAGFPTTISLFFNVMLFLAALAMVNGAIRRRWPGLSFNAAELVTIYSMLCMASAMGGLDMVLVLTPLLTHHSFGATSANNWAGLFDGKLPTHLLVTAPEAIEAFYEGGTTLYRAEHLLPWVKPVLLWTGFLTTLFFTTMCVNVLFLKQWTQKERLAFPIAELPLAMATRPGTLLLNRAFLIGAALAGALSMLNGLHHLYPDVPAIPVRAQDIDLTGLFRGMGHPWDAVGWFPVSYYPCVIGLSFLMPLDLMFSCWIFFLFWKAQRIAFAWLGVLPLLPNRFMEQEATGAYLGIVVGAVWIGREHLWNGLRSAWRSGQGKDDQPLSHRAACAGILFGFVALVLFASWAGLTPGLAALFFLLYLSISAGIARMRAACGPPTHDLHRAGPDEILTTTLGTQSLSGTSLGAMTLFFGFNRAYRGHPAAHSIEGFRLAEQTKGPQRIMFLAQLLGLFIGSLCAFWIFLHASYSNVTGAPNITSWRGQEGYGRLQRWIEHPVGPDTFAWLFYAFGFMVVLALPLLRAHLPGFPLHPIGFAVSSGWSMHLIWFPVLIGWACKRTVVRYGGRAGYQRALPFFLGLILGDYLVGGFWSLVSVISGKRGYVFWGG